MGARYCINVSRHGHASTSCVTEPKENISHNITCQNDLSFQIFLPLFTLA